MDSPTLCRPNQIEIEKLRTCLSSKEFQGIRYHEAVLFKGEKSKWKVQSHCVKFIECSDRCLCV